MAIPIHLDIVSPEAQIFSGLVDHIQITGIEGELGVMRGHAPLLTALKPGTINMTLQNGDQEVVYVSGGMLEIQPEVVTILADTAKRATDLDEAAALEAKKRAEEALLNKQAEWAMTMNEQRRAAELFVAANDFQKAIDLAGKNKWADL